MHIEIVTIGNELLNGDLADTNTARLGTLLRQHGLFVRAGQTVPDVRAAIIEALRIASRADVVLVSGGLGPTEDDLTVSSMADLMAVPLVEHTPTLERIKARFASRGFPFTPNNAQQALVPEGAEVFDNPVGTAPHVQVQHGKTRYFFFPGVPSELARLADDYLVPWLAANAPVKVYRSAIFKTFGKTESQVATLLDGLLRDPRMHVAYRAHMPEIQVSLHVDAADAEGRELLERSASHVREALGDIVYAEDAKASLVSVIARELIAAGQTIATAESCTGGLVAKMCTDLAGSSAWFKEGVVAYDNAVKVARLGVPTVLLAAHGAVSREVCQAMAEGIVATANTDWGLAVTGIAGPGGGTETKPVGLVYVALAGRGRPTKVVERRLPFDRERNRVVSAYAVLDLLRRALMAAEQIA